MKSTNSKAKITVLTKKAKSELTSDQNQEIKDAFDIFDVGNKNEISAKEVRIALRALNFDVNKDEINELLGSLNLNENSKLTYDDFYEIISSKMVKRDPIEEIKKNFRLLCAPNKDTISLDCLSKLANELSENMSKEELTEMIREADKDQDGIINEEDFIEFMNTNMKEIYN